MPEDGLLLPDCPQALRGLAFAVVDLETTGGCPTATWDKDGRFRPAAEITEIGLVQLIGSVRQASFSALCAVEGPIPSAIQRLTGIRPSMLTDAPSWEQVALRMLDVMEGRLWVAHNAGFDGAFLRTYLPEAFWKRHTLLCTVRLAARLVPEAPRRSLGFLATFLGLDHAHPHRALPDAEATAELLQVLLARAEQNGWDGERFVAEGRVRWR